MTGWALATIAALSMVGASSEPPAGGSLAHAAVTIRVYDQIDLPAPLMAAALTAADAIFDAAQIDVRWIACGPAMCGDPFGDREFGLRISATPPSTRQMPASTMGYAVVGTTPGKLSTVFGDRVLVTSARSRINPGALLGRAIAHEIGHLLLGSASHASAGLMRAKWTPEELRDDRAADWLFSSKEAAAIRQRIVSRFGTQQAASLDAWPPKL